MYVVGSGRRRSREGLVDKRIGYIYPSCRYMESVGFVFGLRWCGWCRCGIGRELGTGSGRVEWCYVCVSCESM